MSISDDSTKVVYVVDIPKSTTAHQATDHRYYKRYNFQSIAMEDYEVRDVMRRATTPNAEIEFSLFTTTSNWEEEDYHRCLKAIIRNQGTQVIERFKIILLLTNVGWYEPPDNYSANCLVKRQYIFDDECITHKFLGHNKLDLEIVYQSKNVLFPKENVDIGKKLNGLTKIEFH